MSSATTPVSFSLTFLAHLTILYYDTGKKKQRYISHIFLKKQYFKEEQKENDVDRIHLTLDYDN